VPSGASFSIVQLDSDFTLSPQPKPIGEECGPPQVDDGVAPDAAPALDVKSAWFDVDDANVYANIQVADLPATAPSGTTYSWAMHWRNQHSTRFARAILDEDGQLTFDFGYYNTNPALPFYSGATSLTGDYRIGADGIVRIWIPRSILGYADGDLLRDTSARSQISSNGETAEIDQAPNGSSPAMGTGGDFLIKKCGRTATPTLLDVASRKVHGDGATFDVDLTNGGIECRSGGANGAYILVFTFLDRLTNVENVTVTGGSVSNRRIGSDPHQYIVDLTGVANRQTVTVSLTNVTDDSGNSSPSVPAIMRVLIGDSSADGTVNSTDISEVKSQSGSLISSSNFREDLNADGNINSADIGLVKSKSGTALP
jgi:hypothetical protein